MDFLILLKIKFWRCWANMPLGHDWLEHSRSDPSGRTCIRVTSSPIPRRPAPPAPPPPAIVCLSGGVRICYPSFKFLLSFEQYKFLPLPLSAHLNRYTSPMSAIFTLFLNGNLYVDIDCEI